MPKYTTILLSKLISETDVTGSNIVFSNVDGHEEGGRERKLNEPSIAASGYMVIIARLVSVADNDEDEEGKVKTNLLIVVPLFALSGPALFVTDDPLSALSFSDIDVESERSDERIHAETIRTLIERYKEKK